VRLRHIATLSLWVSLAAGCGAAPATESRNPPTLPPPPTVSAESALVPVTADNIARISYQTRLTQPESETPATLFDHALNRDGTRLVGINDALMFAWDVVSGDLRFTTARLDVVRVFFSSDSAHIYGISAAGAVIRFDANDGAGVGQFSGIDGASGVTAYDPARGLLALGALDGRVKVWDVAAGVALATVTAGDSAVTGLTFTPDGESVVAAVGSTLRRIAWRDRTITAERTIARAQALTQVVSSPDGAWIGAATDFNVVLWSLTDPGRALALDSRVGGASQLLTFSSDGRYLVAGSRAVGMTVWDIGGGEQMARLPLTSASSIAGAFVPGAPLLITTGLDLGVRAWDVAGIDGQTINQAVLDVGTTRIHSAAWTPDARRLLLFDAGGAVYVWGVAG